MVIRTLSDSGSPENNNVLTPNRESLIYFKMQFSKVEEIGSIMLKLGLILHVQFLEYILRI